VQTQTNGKRPPHDQKFVPPPRLRDNFESSRRTHIPQSPSPQPDVPDPPSPSIARQKSSRLRAEPWKRKFCPLQTSNALGVNQRLLPRTPTFNVNARLSVRIPLLVENTLPESTSTCTGNGPRSPLEQERRPLHQIKTHLARRNLPYEFTATRKGNLFLSRARPHACRNDRPSPPRLFHRPPAKFPIRRTPIMIRHRPPECAILPRQLRPNPHRLHGDSNGHHLQRPLPLRSLPHPLIARSASCPSPVSSHLGWITIPFISHGNQFVITAPATEGGRAPESTWYRPTKFSSGVAQAKVVEFEAKYPRYWRIHCHLSPSMDEQA